MGDRQKWRFFMEIKSTRSIGSNKKGTSVKQDLNSKAIYIESGEAEMQQADLIFAIETLSRWIAKSISGENNGYKS